MVAIRSGTEEDTMRAKYLMIVSLAVAVAAPASAQTWKDVLGKVTGSQQESEEKGATVTQDEAAGGLKEALKIGAEKAVELASKEDGFFGNELIRIPLPKPIRSVGDTLRRFGMGKSVDDFELSMNRAAERASAKATPILIDAVKGLTIEDAVAILRGGDTAATDLLRARTGDKLTEELRPIIGEAMAEVGVTRNYNRLVSKAGPLLSAAGQEQQDLDEYVTDKGLDGLFTLIAQEETKIRKDPLERTTDLLKKVFGSLTK